MRNKALLIYTRKQFSLLIIQGEKLTLMSFSLFFVGWFLWLSMMVKEILLLLY